jgi:hypothetical protein
MCSSHRHIKAGAAMRLLLLYESLVVLHNMVESLDIEF